MEVGMKIRSLDDLKRFIAAVGEAMATAGHNK